MIEQAPAGDGTVELTFRLPADEPPGDVSVVGDFNAWQPGIHQLQPASDGTRVVSVTVPAGPHHFRYLASGGLWRDDEQADHVTPDGSVVHCIAADVASGQPAKATSRSKRRSADGGTARVPAKPAKRRTARRG